MTIDIRRASQRSYFDYGWLKTCHTFSFDESQSSNHMGFRSLRAIHENWMNPSVGFPIQFHHDVEIISIILEGGVTHQDSLGNGSIIRAGQIELVSAGRGIEHSAFNASDREHAHFYQFWLAPRQSKLKPSYLSKFFDPAVSHNKWCLILSGDGQEGALQINQEVSVYLVSLDSGRELASPLKLDRFGWLQVMEGSIRLGEEELTEGDGVAMAHVETFSLKALSSCRLVFFDLN